VLEGDRFVVIMKGERKGGDGKRRKRKKRMAGNGIV